MRSTALKKDEVIKCGDAGRDVPGLHDDYKRDEWERFLATVTDWDLDRLLPATACRELHEERRTRMCGIAGLIHRDRTGATSARK